MYSPDSSKLAYWISYFLIVISISETVKIHCSFGECFAEKANDNLIFIFISHYLPHKDTGWQGLAIVVSQKKFNYGKFTTVYVARRK